MCGCVHDCHAQGNTGTHITVFVFAIDVQQRPVSVLRFCGFKPSFDRALIVSPMRENLSIKLKWHPDGTTSKNVCLAHIQRLGVANFIV